MGRRGKILAGMAAGAVWSGWVLVVGKLFNDLGLYAGHGLRLAFFACGIVLMAMIARLAQRRFFNDDIIDGDAYPEGSPAEIDQRVLTNTVEQLVLAGCLWPFIGQVLQNGVVLALALSFVIARLAFWIGYHVSPPLRAFGFAATFYPTILVSAFAVAVGWASGYFAL